MPSPDNDTPTHDLDDETSSSANERNRILDAAVKAIAIHRQGDPGVHDILREAGVSGRTLYAHFPSKDALYVALLSRHFDRELQTIIARVEECDDPAERAEAWLDAFLDYYFVPEERAKWSVVTSGPVPRANGYSDEIRHCRHRISEVLAESLAKLDRPAQTPPSQPSIDAATLRTVADTVCSGLLISDPNTDRETAKAYIKRFGWTAVGLAE